jgi:hypothetical protein
MYALPAGTHTIQLSGIYQFTDYSIDTIKLDLVDQGCQTDSAVDDMKLSSAARALVPTAGGCAHIPGHDFDGHDVEQHENVGTAEECGRLCLANPECVFFSRTRWGGCYLKSVEAGYSPGRVVSWADTGRCARPAAAVGDDSAEVTLLKAQLSKAEQVAASRQAETAELVSKNGLLQAIINGIQALLALLVE